MIQLETGSADRFNNCEKFVRKTAAAMRLHMPQCDPPPSSQSPKLSTTTQQPYRASSCGGVPRIAQRSEAKQSLAEL